MIDDEMLASVAQFDRPKRLERPKSPTGFRPRAYKVDIDHEHQAITVHRAVPARDALWITMTVGRVLGRLKADAVKPTFPEFEREMLEAGVRIVPRFNKDGKLNGLVYATDSVSLNASDIADDGNNKPLTVDGLKAIGVDLDVDRDAEHLRRMLVERVADPVRNQPFQAEQPEGKQVVDHLWKNGISKKERERNATLLTKIAKDGWDSARVAVVSGDKSAGRFYEGSDMLPLRSVKDERGKWWKEIDPTGAAKVFTDQGDGTYTKTSYGRASEFHVKRGCVHGSIGDFIKAAQGFYIAADYVDPEGDHGVAWDKRRLHPQRDVELGRLNPERVNGMLLEAGRSIVGDARGMPSKEWNSAITEPGVSMEQAVIAARAVGLEPQGVGEDGAIRHQEGFEAWLWSELSDRADLPKRPSEFGVDIFLDTKAAERAAEKGRDPVAARASAERAEAALWAQRGRDGQIKFMVEQQPAAAMTWLAGTRFVDLAQREGWAATSIDHEAATFMPIRQNWLGLDLDGVKLPDKEHLHRVPEFAERYPDGLDIGQRPEEVARWWLETFGPDEFKGAAFYWQHSSSAGWEKTGDDKVRFVDVGNTGKADIHIFVPLEGYHDIEDVGSWFALHAKDKLAKLVEAGVYEVPTGPDAKQPSAKGIMGLDPAFQRPVQALYVRPPSFIDANGNVLPDPLAGRRDGEEPGRDVQVPKLSAKELELAHRDADAKLVHVGVNPKDTAPARQQPERSVNRERGASIPVSAEPDAALREAAAGIGRDGGGGFNVPMYRGMLAYVKSASRLPRKEHGDPLDITTPAGQALFDEATAAMDRYMREVSERPGAIGPGDARYAAPGYINDLAMRTMRNVLQGRQRSAEMSPRPTPTPSPSPSLSPTPIRSTPFSTPFRFPGQRPGAATKQPEPEREREPPRAPDDDLTPDI
jgi:hypothetical protein